MRWPPTHVGPSASGRCVVTGVVRGVLVMLYRHPAGPQRGSALGTWGWQDLPLLAAAPCPSRRPSVPDTQLRPTPGPGSAPVPLCSPSERGASGLGPRTFVLLPRPPLPSPPAGHMTSPRPREPLPPACAEVAPLTSLGSGQSGHWDVHCHHAAVHRASSSRGAPYALSAFPEPGQAF